MATNDNQEITVDEFVLSLISFTVEEAHPQQLVQCTSAGCMPIKLVSALEFLDFLNVT